MQLETKRLRLIPYEHHFADEIFEVVKKKEIADTMLMIPHPYPRESVNLWIDYLQECAVKSTALEFALFTKEQKPRYIGNCGLVDISKTHRHAEGAYFIAVEEWGKGYATEAFERIIEFGFTELALERISSRCMTRNSASRKVMEKVGLVYEGTFRRQFLKNGQFEDIDYLALLADEWRK